MIWLTLFAVALSLAIAYCSLFTRGRHSACARRVW